MSDHREKKSRNSHCSLPLRDETLNISPICAVVFTTLDGSLYLRSPLFCQVYLKLDSRIRSFWGQEQGRTASNHISLTEEIVLEVIILLFICFHTMEFVWSNGSISENFCFMLFTTKRFSCPKSQSMYTFEMFM